MKRPTLFWDSSRSVHSLVSKLSSFHINSNRIRWVPTIVQRQPDRLWPTISIGGWTTKPSPTIVSSWSYAELLVTVKVPIVLNSQTSIFTSRHRRRRRRSTCKRWTTSKTFTTKSPKKCSTMEASPGRVSSRSFPSQRCWPSTSSSNIRPSYPRASSFRRSSIGRRLSSTPTFKLGYRVKTIG